MEESVHKSLCVCMCVLLLLLFFTSFSFSRLILNKQHTLLQHWLVSAPHSLKGLELPSTAAAFTGDDGAIILEGLRVQYLAQRAIFKEYIFLFQLTSSQVSLALLFSVGPESEKTSLHQKNSFWKSRNVWLIVQREKYAATMLQCTVQYLNYFYSIIDWIFNLVILLSVNWSAGAYRDQNSVHLHLTYCDICLALQIE